MEQLEQMEQIEQLEQMEQIEQMEQMNQMEPKKYSKSIKLVILEHLRLVDLAIKKMLEQQQTYQNRPGTILNNSHCLRPFLRLQNYQKLIKMLFFSL